ncbi:RDD family protein [Roseateles sp. DAIF2]|uniref:RDD family protein n=1 Tax=Roseateles sp. DAIF2 TaxID=2714952 RepID=UPI001BC94423|nr:RDD family protein [Roseateles sp. DAIF2]
MNKQPGSGSGRRAPRSLDPTMVDHDAPVEEEEAPSPLSDLRPAPKRPPRRPAPTAPFGTRVWALLLDVMLMLALSMPLMWLAYGETIAQLNDLRPLSLAINWLLPALLCITFWTWQGATPGKLLTGIRVVDARSGARPSPAQAALRWVGYLLSALPLGLGFAWAGFDPDRLAWHDKLAGTRVVRRTRRDGTVADEYGSSYIGRHWRGELSLAQSYWVNNVLLSVPLALALSALMTWISMKGEALQAGSIAVLIGWPLIVVVSLWCIVGAWRAASAYLRENGSLLWGWLARLSLIGSAVQLLLSTLVGFGPQMDEYWQLARGTDPIGQATFKLSADGRTLRLDGPIGMGDATRLQTVLAGTRQPVRLFELASPGGRVYEAERMVEMVKKAGAGTRAVGGCESACTLVFLAGAQRQLMPGAQLGFHRASSGTYNPVFDEMANRELSATYRRMGLPEYFVERTARTPAHSMWYPKNEELVAHALVAAPPQTLDVELPGGADASLLEAHADALRGNPAWYRLEQRFPGLLDEAARAMLAVRSSSSSAPGAAAPAESTVADAAQLAALRVLAPRLPELIVAAPPELRRRYLVLLRAQLRATASMAGEPACRALLGGDLAWRRQLPVELLAQETSWMGAAAEAELPRWLPRPPSGVELEVVRRTLGAQAPGLFLNLWTGGGSAGGCEQAIRLIDSAARLPVAQRELAERLMFQGRAG